MKEPVLDELKINEGLLSSLLQYDESLRTGQSPELLLDSAEPDQMTDFELGQAALQELEAAIPRRMSVMPSWAPQRIGRFEIRSVLGAGGFAVVYLAFDPTLNRLVALKIPRPHALIRPDLRRRFVTEAQAAAQLDHPHIVPVFEAGEDLDLPYIVCALCDGPTLAHWLSSRTTPMNPKTAAAVVRDLATAVQFSHDRGILHRDIKPGNVLLFPDASRTSELFPYVARLADFGLAKLLESGELDTVTSQLIGTPRYMAPELIKGSVNAGDISPDVYALGAMLYCLLLGQPPFGSATSAEIVRRIVEEDPASPEIVDPAVGRDLSLICLKCLQKAPTLRYLSAAQLADDLDRFISGRPVLARRAPVHLQFEKWCRRRPAIAILLALTTGLASVFLVFALRYTSKLQDLQGELLTTNRQLQQRVVDLDIAVDKASRHEAESNQNRLIADEQVFAADLKLADSMRQFGDVRGACVILDRYDQNRAGLSVIDGRKSFAWRYLKGQTTAAGVEMPDTGQTVWDLQFSPSGDRVAQCGDKGRIRILDVDDEYRILNEHQIAATELNCVAWCRTSPILATGGDDGLVRILDANNLEVLKTLEAFPGQHVYGLTFSPDSPRFYVGVSSEMQFWDAESEQLVQRIATPHRRGIEHLFCSLDGTRIVTGGEEGELCVWRRDNHSVLWQRTITNDEIAGPVSIVRVTPDGRYVIAAALKETLIVFNAKTGEELRRWRGLNRIHALAVDNNRIFCGDSHGLMSEFAVEHENPEWRPVRQWRGHEGKISTTVFVPPKDEGANSTELLSTDRNGTARRWMRNPANETLSFRGSSPAIDTKANEVCWIDSRTLVQATPGGLESLDTDSEKITTVFRSPAGVTGVQYAPDANCLVVADALGQITVVPFESPPRPPLVVWENGVINNLSVDRSAARAVVQSVENEVAVLDLRQSRILLKLTDREASTISPDGRWIVSGNRKTDAFDVYDATTLKLIQSLKDIDPTYESISFSADSKQFVSAGNNRTVTVWNLEGDKWQVVHSIFCSSNDIGYPTFHPNGRTLAVAVERGGVMILDVPACRELLTISLGLEDTRQGLSFSPDGNQLAAEPLSGNVVVIRARP